MLMPKNSKRPIACRAFDPEPWILRYLPASSPMKGSGTLMHWAMAKTGGNPVQAVLRRKKTFMNRPGGGDEDKKSGKY